VARILVQVTAGPGDGTKAGLAFLVAKTALSKGHEVSLFLAGEGVRLLSDDALNRVEGVGTGVLQDHYQSIVDNGGKFFLSRMSAKARGFDDSLAKGKPAEFAMPDDLVRMIVEADRSVTY